MDNSTSIQEAIGNQLGASIEMLENAVLLCPSDQWDTAVGFWYIAYHAAFWTDYYLTTEPSQFQPPLPFTLSEFDPTGKMPDRAYTKAELLGYLAHCQQKATLLVSTLTIEKLGHRWVNDYKNFSLLEILLYNTRHIQHHAAQLNLLLRQTINNAPAWVSQAKKITDAQTNTEGRI